VSPASGCPGHAAAPQEMELGQTPKTPYNIYTLGLDLAAQFWSWGPGSVPVAS